MKILYMLPLLFSMYMCNASAPVPNNSPHLHAVFLSWQESSFMGKTYNVYRSTLVSGPYTQIAKDLAVTSYKDSAVQKRQTYYYVTTSTDLFGRESAYSNSVKVTIPNP